MSVLDHPHPAHAPAAEDVDLRLPVIGAVLFAITAAALTQPVVALIAFAAAGLLAAARGARLREALHRLAHVEGFLLILLAFLPFTTPGTPLVRLGPLVASTEGVGLGLMIALKVNTVALLLLALPGRAVPEHLGRALHALGAPPRFVRLLELLLRHSHTARDGLLRQSQAMRARAFRPRTSLHTWRSYGHLFGGALLRAFDRAERVDEAMRMRGAGALAPAALPPLSLRAVALVVTIVATSALFLIADRLL